MFKFGLQNLRRLREVEPIELRPITLLVGRNSSGKSSFLRTFPLLRQSLQTRTSSPILWYGDFVDFGNFEGVVSDNDVSRKIGFTFGVDRVQSGTRRYFSGHRGYGIHTFSDVELIVELAGDSAKNYLSGFKISYNSGEYRFHATLTEDGRLKSLKLNGSTVTQHFDGSTLAFTVGSILPYIEVIPERDAVDANIFTFRTEPLLAAVTRIIEPHLDKRTRREQIEKLAGELIAMNDFTEESLTEVELRPGQRSFRKLIRDVKGKNTKKLRDNLKEVYVTSRFEYLAQSTFETLRQYLSQTLYMGPVRARSERYYRYQELAVSEIDPDGKNFPMFLNSLTEKQRADFSHWVQSRFGYGVELSQPAGHISINLVVGENTTNIVDNGYGISQVLPVLGQVWWAANRPRTRVYGTSETPPILLIEQPELHLHPAHQALLADAFVAEHGTKRSPRSSGRNLQFVIETHSEALVNRIGTLISDGVLEEKDVQILIFESVQDEERVTSVRRAFYDGDGVLSNWPYGFFQPEVA